MSTGLMLSVICIAQVTRLRAAGDISEGARHSSSYSVRHLGDDMKGFLKAAAFAGLLVATGAQAADLGAPASMGGYKDDIAYSWWNAGDIFVRLRGEAVLPDFRSNGYSTQIKAADSAIPEVDISYFLTKNIAIEAICCVSPHDVNMGSTQDWRDHAVPAHRFAAIPLRHGQD